MGLLQGRKTSTLPLAGGRSARRKGGNAWPACWLACGCLLAVWLLVAILSQRSGADGQEKLQDNTNDPVDVHTVRIAKEEETRYRGGEQGSGTDAWKTEAHVADVRGIDERERLEQMEKQARDTDPWKDSLEEKEDPWQMEEYVAVEEHWKMKNLPDCSMDATPLCKKWAEKGQCASSPISMMRFCGKSCCLQMNDPEKKKLVEAAKAIAGGTIWSELTNSNATIRTLPEGYMVSWKPRIMALPNFLSAEECEHLIALASDNLMPSKVVTKKEDGTTTSTPSKSRTSSGFFLTDAFSQDPVVRAIDARMETVIHVPHGHAEALHILRYQIGEKYLAHNDYFQEDAIKADPRGQRMATLLMYLSDVEEGGETNFPHAVPVQDLPMAILEKTGVLDWPACGESTSTGISVRPKKGSAVLFWDLKPDGTRDPASLHASCPVAKGEKWSGTHWIRTNSGRSSLPPP